MTARKVAWRVADTLERIRRICEHGYRTPWTDRQSKFNRLTVTNNTQVEQWPRARLKQRYSAGCG